MVALVALVGCKKDNNNGATTGEDLKENDAYYESFTITNCGIFNEPEMIAGTEQQFQIDQQGTTVNAQLANFDFIAWGSGVTYSENTNKFSGKGFVINSVVPVYIITSPAEYANQYFLPEGGYKIGNTSTPAEGVMAAGKIDAASYGDWIAYLNGETKTVDSAAIFSKTAGTLFSLNDYDDTQSYPESYAGLYRGQINKIVIKTDDNGAVTSWGADVTWSNMTSDIRMYGFQIDPETKTLVRPYNYKSVNRKFHEDVLNAAPSAPARAPRAIRSVSELRRPLTLKK